MDVIGRETHLYVGAVQRGSKTLSRVSVYALSTSVASSPLPYNKILFLATTVSLRRSHTCVSNIPCSIGEYLVYDTLLSACGCTSVPNELKASNPLSVGVDFLPLQEVPTPRPLFGPKGSTYWRTLISFGQGNSVLREVGCGTHWAALENCI